MIPGAVELVTVTPDPAGATETARTVAAVLERHGIPVRGRRVVPAGAAEAERALRQATEGGGLVVGIGEAEGAEVIRGALARVAGARLVLSERSLEALADAHARRGLAMPRRAERLALVPQGATVLVAAGGGEPGVWLELGDAAIALVPDQPAVAIALVTEQLLPRLEPDAPGPMTRVRTLRLVGLDAGEVDARLVPVLREVTGARAHALSRGGEVWVRLGISAPTVAAVDELFRQLDPALRLALGPAWYGIDDEALEVVVGRLLRARRLTVALAESCTGGLVGHRLTQVPGSSSYFERGFLVYSNAAKQALLGVDEALLGEHGAVSAACAEAMARGARARAETDLGLSVTGIAGPDGGTPTKPVGLVFIGLADREDVVSHRFRFGQDRQGNKALSATMALDLLRRYCLEGARPGAERGSAPPGR